MKIFPISVISNLVILFLRLKGNQIKIKNKVSNDKFTIISNNCWAAEVYKELDLQYNTPFIGLFVFAPCYLKLLKKLKKYMEMDLKFVDCSRYEEANKLRLKKNYPIGILDDDIEIHFLHYLSQNEAREKWNRRKQRINWNNLLIKFDDRDRCSSDLIEEFDNLPYIYKVCFVSQEKDIVGSAIWIKACCYNNRVVDGKALYNVSKNYFNLSKWLNLSQIKNQNKNN